MLKLPAIWYTGIPDRIVLLSGGRIFFVELKKKGYVARENQKRWIRVLRRLGFRAGVVAGPEALDKFITTHVEG